jgi:hypothetical protein
MDFLSFLFVRTSYKSTFLNRSDNTWRHLHLHILSHFPPSSALPVTYFYCRSTAQTCQPTQSRVCLRRHHAVTWDRLLEDSPRVSSSLSDRACVCVCVHRRVVTYSGHFLLRYSHGTFFCNVLNALRRLRPLTCVRSYVSQPPAWLHFPDISIFAITTHSFSHFCTLSSTHFCSCFLCHYYDVPFAYTRKERRTSGFAIGNPGQHRAPRIVINKYKYTYYQNTHMLLCERGGRKKITILKDIERERERGEEATIKNASGW